jgi:uncharacterized OB-fold protein
MQKSDTFRIGHFPQQYEDYNKLHQFYDLLREGRFTTTRCRNCGNVQWPPRTVCPACLGDLFDYVDMPKLGKVYAYTVQEAGVPPGYAAPLVYALVDFDNGIRIFTALIETRSDDVKTGADVEVVLREVSPDHLGRKRMLPFFRMRK